MGLTDTDSDSDTDTDTDTDSDSDTDADTDTGALAIDIYAGNGQATWINFTVIEPLVAQVTNGLGDPVAGVEVAWEVVEGTGYLTPWTTFETGEDGLVEAWWSLNYLDVNYSWETDYVEASIDGSSVEFVVTGLDDGGGFPAQPDMHLDQPTMPYDLGSGSAGSVITGAVQMRVYASTGLQAGQPIPNIGLKVVDADSYVAEAAWCQGLSGDVILSNADGEMICDLELGDETGSFDLEAIVGSSWEFPGSGSMDLEITP
jgi:hypothetical protein